MNDIEPPPSEDEDPDLEILTRLHAALGFEPPTADDVQEMRQTYDRLQQWDEPRKEAARERLR